MKHINSLQFSQKLSSLFDSVGDLMVTTSDGRRRIEVDDDPSPFEFTSSFSRPAEYLQCMLDIVRTIYEPDIIATLFLNSNPFFIFDSIPETKFHLGYLSQVKPPDITFADFWQEVIIPRIAECGYNMQTTDSIFLCITVGSHDATLAAMDDVSSVLKANFSLSETLALLKATYNDTPLPEKEYFAGYCVDEALENKMRVSLWLFSKSGPHSI